MALKNVVPRGWKQIHPEPEHFAELLKPDKEPKHALTTPIKIKRNTNETD